MKEIIVFLFRFIGGTFILREVFFRNKVIILFYHNPKPEIFYRHIAYISKNYNIITISTLVKCIYKKNFSEIPAKSIIITIDDGFKENFKLLEIIKEFNICPSIYLSSNIINTSRHFWFESGLVPDEISKLKKYKNSERLKILKKKVGFEQIKEYPIRKALNIQELQEMSSSVDFQSHGKFHPILTTCSDKESFKEIYDSKKKLELLLKKKIEHFAYPNGDYGDREIAYLQQCGYSSARTTEIGFNDVNTNPFRLKVMTIDENASVNRLSVQISGFFKYLRKLSLIFK